MRKLFIALTAMLAAPFVPAHAHAFLLGAVPAVGSAVRSTPPVLRLNFSEGIELRFSGVEVTDAGGHGVAARNIRASPGDAAILLLDLPLLPAGSYRVHWHVVSVDTHVTEGDFSFTVRP